MPKVSISSSLSDDTLISDLFQSGYWWARDHTLRVFLKENLVKDVFNKY